jgi:hypothetical protein
MNIADELQKLQQLDESGALNDEEFARAKEAVLNSTPPSRAGGSAGEGRVGNLFGGKNESLGDAANRYVSFQIVMAVVGLIVFLLFFFLFFLPHWNSFPKL